MTFISQLKLSKWIEQELWNNEAPLSSRWVFLSLIQIYWKKWFSAKAQQVGLQCVTPARHMQEKHSPSYTHSSNLWFLIWMPYTESLGFFQFNLIGLFIWHWNVFCFHRLNQVPCLLVFWLLPQAANSQTYFFICMNSNTSCFLNRLFFVVFTFTTFKFQSYVYFSLCILYLCNLKFFWEIF